MTTLHPAKDYVILKPLTEEKSKSGLIINTPEGKQHVMGRVYKVGAGKQPFPVPMEEGDIVVYEKYMDNTIAIPMLSEEINPVKFENLTVLIKEEKK